MAYFDTIPNEVFEFENYNPNLPAEAAFTFFDKDSEYYRTFY